MQLKLPPELQQYVAEKVKAGQFADPGDVEALRREIRIGPTNSKPASMPTSRPPTSRPKGARSSINVGRPADEPYPAITTVADQLFTRTAYGQW